MNELLAGEPWIRGIAFAASIGMLLALEAISPRRTSQRAHVWSNVGLFLTGSLAVRLVCITSVTGVASLASAKGWGLLHSITFPYWSEYLIAILVLDFSMYLQHRIFHWVPWLWRLHAVHHSDTAFDVTTGIRFHVGELLVSFVLKLVVVVALGASVAAVLVFEVLLSTASLFTHTNVRLVPKLDAGLRAVVVTPDMHRIHHSTENDEHNHNFGFLLIWWDRLLGSYRESPRAEHTQMRIGLDAYRSATEQKLWPLLKQPFAQSDYREYAARR